MKAKKENQSKLSAAQIRLVQKAAREAGIRGKNFDGRYRMLLAQYKQSNGRPVTSCKQLNNSQLEDMLAICEANGWRMPGKPKDFYRLKVHKKGDYASFAQQSAIRYLKGDLGWSDEHLAGFLQRMTEQEGWYTRNVASLTPGQGYKIIEALKKILGRERGKHYSNLKQIQKDMEVATDGKTSQTG